MIHQSNASGNIDLRAWPLAGGESRFVVATPHQDYHPFVSPSGKWLYFQLDHKNIYRVPGPAQDWRKAEPEKITNFPESGLFLEDPQLSRDVELSRQKNNLTVERGVELDHIARNSRTDCRSQRTRAVIRRTGYGDCACRTGTAPERDRGREKTEP